MTKEQVKDVLGAPSGIDHYFDGEHWYYNVGCSVNFNKDSKLHSWSGL